MYLYLYWQGPESPDRTSSAKQEHESEEIEENPLAKLIKDFNYFGTSWNQKPKTRQSHQRVLKRGPWNPEEVSKNTFPGTPSGRGARKWLKMGRL